MSTLGIMKARIADELGQRSDLENQIGYAISDAIAAYQERRFHFNEGRAIVFPTVIGQEFYNQTEFPALGTIAKIDYVMIYYGEMPNTLLAMTPAQIESASVSATNVGAPGWYCWYGNELRLYPAPAGTWNVRIGAGIKAAAPVDDNAEGNPWMTHAERLIRSRAKLELALHVLKDTDLASTMNEATEEALTQLISRTNQLTQVGQGRIMPMEF